MEQQIGVEAPQKSQERIERRTVSLYPRDWAVVEGMSQRLGVGVSGALRMVIRTWDGLDGGSDGDGEKSE